MKTIDPTSTALRHVKTLYDLTAEEIQRVFDLTGYLKRRYEQGVREPHLRGRVLALLFEKPSLRTRVSFQSAMAHLGGTSFMLGEDTGYRERESVADFSRILSQYVDVLVVRSRQHATVEEMARHASCPIINGLTDRAHPCQALADLYTLLETTGSLRGRRLTFIGDGNNVARSLAVGCARMDMEFCLSGPRDYHFDAAFVEQLRKAGGASFLHMTEDPRVAVQGASAVYTDVWASMGQEQERAARRRVFSAFQVNEALMQAAPDDAVFMHCLPARRGEEVTDAVIDGPQSVVVPQAANRMHVQKGILAWMLGIPLNC